MKVELLDYTQKAKELLIFTKHTRRMDGIIDFQRVGELLEEDVDKELKYIFQTISGPWEFVDYIFHISGVSRVFTHQIVRHRVGTSFSQESMRIANKSGFEYLESTKHLLYRETMDEINKNYSEMVDAGVPIQDARGILPTNILTNITAKFNLRSLNTLMNTRLCVRTAGEFQEVAKEMRRLVLEVHPWAESVLLPFCLEWGVCKFQNFDGCPIKKKYSWLNKDTEVIEEAKQFWSKITFSPQPK